MPEFPPEFRSVRKRNADSAFLLAKNFFASSVGAILDSRDASQNGEDMDARDRVESQSWTWMVVFSLGIWEDEARKGTEFTQRNRAKEPRVKRQRASSVPLGLWFYLYLV